jgi:acyl CoA:acetate/3-ketoacid CoA transferase alpha subunit
MIREWPEMRKAQLHLDMPTEGTLARGIDSAGMGFAFFPLLEGTLHG